MHVVQAATRCLYLDEGRSVMLSEPAPAIDRYLRDQAEGMECKSNTPSGAPGITQVQLLDAQGRAIHEVEAGAPVTLRVHWNLPEPLAGPVVTLDMLHDDPRYPIATPGRNLAQLSSGELLKDEVVSGAGAFDVRLDGLHLPVGMYSVRAALKARDALTAGMRRDDALRFEVRRPPGSDSNALIELAQQWSVCQPSEAGHTGAHE
jgi:hypothetical protein